MQGEKQIKARVQLKKAARKKRKTVATEYKKAIKNLQNEKREKNSNSGETI